MKRLLSAVFAVSLLAGTVAVAHADNSYDSHGRDRDSRHWNDRNDRHHDGDARSHERDYGSHWYRERDHRWSNNNNWRDDHRSDRDRHDGDRRDWNRHDHDYAWRGAPSRYRIEAYRWPSGYRHYAWSRGDYLPSSYRAPRYVVYDYGRYGLYAPPRGCHWVRVGNDVLLTAVTTGVVVNIVSDLFY